MTDAADGELDLEQPDGTAPGPGQHSAADPERPKSLRKRQKLEDRERIEFWHAVFATETGRREMWRLLSKLHPFNARMGTTPAGMPDERATWMFLAEQLVGQRIFQEWYAQSPQLVLLMQAENDPLFPKPVKP